MSVGVDVASNGSLPSPQLVVSSASEYPSPSSSVSSVRVVVHPATNVSGCPSPSAVSYTHLTLPTILLV